MNVAFSIVPLFILLDCVTNEKPLCAKGCHVPLTAFYQPVKALVDVFVVIVVVFCQFHRLLMGFFLVEH